MTEQQKSPLEIAAHLTGSVAFLYLVSYWGFKSEIKKEVWDRQNGLCGEPGCEKPIKEYHHVCPEKALVKKGIKGKNCADNAVGLCFDHHKHKWDSLMFQGVFYPGVELKDLPPNTYAEVHYQPKKKRRRRRR
jgi:hypothetical protein